MFEMGIVKFVWFFEWFLLKKMRVKTPVLVSKKVRGVKPLGTNSLKVNRVHKILDRLGYTVIPPPFLDKPNCSVHKAETVAKLLIRS